MAMIPIWLSVGGLLGAVLRVAVAGFCIVLVRTRGMSEVTISVKYMRRIRFVQLFGCFMAMVTIWLSVGGLLGAVLGGAVAGCCIVSVRLLSEMIQICKASGVDQLTVEPEN